MFAFCENVTVRSTKLSRSPLLYYIDAREGREEEEEEDAKLSIGGGGVGCQWWILFNLIKRSGLSVCELCSK